MIRTLTTAAAAATALLACAGSAAAQEADSPTGSWSFAFGAATDNRSKDASKSDGEPYVWGQTEWEAPSRPLYVGAAFETVKSSTGSELELKVGGGVRPQFGGFDLDLNVTYLNQVDADPGADNDAWEFTGDISRSIGPASGRVRIQHSPEAMGSTDSWTWYEARVGWAFTNKLEATAALGRREQQGNIDYTGWNAGFIYALTDNLEAEVRYHATDVDQPGEQYADALVAGLSIAF